MSSPIEAPKIFRNPETHGLTQSEQEGAIAVFSLAQEFLTGGVRKYNAGKGWEDVEWSSLGVLVVPGGRVPIYVIAPTSDLENKRITIDPSSARGHVVLNHTSVDHRTTSTEINLTDNIFSLSRSRIGEVPWKIIYLKDRELPSTEFISGGAQAVSSSGRNLEKYNNNNLQLQSLAVFLGCRGSRPSLVRNSYFVWALAITN